METKAWWRPTETLYDFVAQCARKVDTERLEHIELRNNEDESLENHIYIKASPKGYLNGKYKTLSFGTHVEEITEEKTKEIITKVVETGRGYNLSFNAEKWHQTARKKFDIEITKGSWLDNIFAPTFLYCMGADGPVSAEDLALYKDIALSLGAVVKPQNGNTNKFEIYEKTDMPYAAKLIGMNRLWNSAWAYKLAFEKGFDVSLSSMGKNKKMYAYFSKVYPISLYADITSEHNLIRGIIDMNEAESLFGLFNSVKEFGGNVWAVEYRMKPKHVKQGTKKQETEPEKPKNIVETSEMQR